MTEHTDDPQYDTPINSPVTVEAEYTPNGQEAATTQQWTFYKQSPRQAKDVVESKLVPYEATIWRIGVWNGTYDDRPDTGHETGILDQVVDEK